MDDLEEIMKDVEKRERKAERYLRTSKRINFFNLLGKKVASLKLNFLLSLFYNVANFVEYQYSKVYEVYYRFKYRRTIQRFQLLAGVSEKSKPEFDEKNYNYGTSAVGNDLIDFYYNQVQKKIQEEEQEEKN